MSRRPRVPSATTPPSASGEPSQKSSYPPPSAGRSHVLPLNMKAKEGSNEKRPYRISGKKHATEAYGG